MERELGRKSIGTFIGAIFMNPGALSYLAAKRKLRKYYKEKEALLRVNGNQSIEKVFEEIDGVLSKM